MIELFRRLFGSGSSDLRRRTVAIYAVLVVANWQRGYGRSCCFENSPSCWALL